MEFAVLDAGRRLRPVEHRGRQNVPAPGDAARLVAAYVALVAEGVFVADRAALAPVPEPEEWSGYDWEAPGEWERVWHLWKPLVPRHLRIGLRRRPDPPSREGVDDLGGTWMAARTRPAGGGRGLVTRPVGPAPSPPDEAGPFTIRAEPTGRARLPCGTQARCGAIAAR